MLDSSPHDANSARERLIDSAILGAILSMLACVLALITWVGWLAYKHAPPKLPKAPVEDVREVVPRG